MAASTSPTSPKAVAQRRHLFARRFLRALSLVVGLIAIALTVGLFGYHFFCGFTWIDSLLNASMILTGMGPVGTLSTTGAKLFASAYALFAAIVFIGATGILLAPIFHHVLHRFHLEQQNVK